MLLPPLPRLLLLLLLRLRASTSRAVMALETATEGGSERRDLKALLNMQCSFTLCPPSLSSRARRTRRTSTEGVGAAASTHHRAMLVADPFAGIPFWRVLALALAVPAVQAILTGINLNWLAVLVSPLHALCFLCILTIQWLWQHPAKEVLMPLWQERSVRHAGLES